MKKEKTNYDQKIVIRTTERIFDLIKAEALEKNTTVSEIIRQAYLEHMERNMSDAEIMHFSIAENTRKILQLEKKIDLAALIILELARKQIRSLPDTNNISDEMAEKKYQKFIEDCTVSLKKNHHGILESMVLDAYEKGE